MGVWSGKHQGNFVEIGGNTLLHTICYLLFTVNTSTKRLSSEDERDTEQHHHAYCGVHVNNRYRNYVLWYTISYGLQFTPYKRRYTLYTHIYAYNGQLVLPIAQPTVRHARQHASWGECH